jgi:hypothetical protein
VPALERVGSLVLCDLPENGVDLPQLRSVTGPTLQDSSFDRPGVQIGNQNLNDLSTPISLPALETIRGTVTIYFPVQLPSLVRIAGSLIIENQISAPTLQEVTAKVSYLRDGLSADNLTTIGGPLGIGYYATTVSLPGLASVDSINAIASPASSGSYLTTLNLPALTTVTGTVASRNPGAIRIRATHLTAISFPALPSLPGNLEIDSNRLLTSLDVPLLTSVGPSLSITSNEDLPNCYATDLLAQLQAAGWSGTWTISGNGSGTCP